MDHENNVAIPHAGEAAQPLRSPEATLELIATTATTLHERIARGGSTVIEGSWYKLAAKNGPRVNSSYRYGVKIESYEWVSQQVGGTSENPEFARRLHMYMLSIEPTSPERWTPGESFRFTLIGDDGSRGTDDLSADAVIITGKLDDEGRTFLAGRGPKGVELQSEEIQAGVDGILAELDRAVTGAEASLFPVLRQEAG
jgi:hypothetical protein